MSAPGADPGFGGWPLVRAAAFFVGLLCAAILWTFGVEEAGTRAAVRGTARASMVFFCAAFVASSARRLWPSDVTTWLVANARYLGFCLGISHAAHAVFLYWLFAHYQPFELGAAAGGLVGYAFLVAMLATSNAAARERMGERAWRALHTLGMYYLWIAFASTMLGSFASAPTFQRAVFSVMAIAALGIRIAGAFRARAEKRLVAAGP